MTKLLPGLHKPHQQDGKLSVYVSYQQATEKAFDIKNFHQDWIKFQPAT